jgi:hypothetical protein
MPVLLLSLALGGALVVGALAVFIASRTEKRSRKALDEAAPRIYPHLPPPTARPVPGGFTPRARGGVTRDAAAGRRFVGASSTPVARGSRVDVYSGGHHTAALYVDTAEDERRRLAAIEAASAGSMLVHAYAPTPAAETCSSPSYDGGSSSSSYDSGSCSSDSGGGGSFD